MFVPFITFLTTLREDKVFHVDGETGEVYLRIGREGEDSVDEDTRRGDFLVEYAASTVRVDGEGEFVVVGGHGMRII